MRLVTYDAGAGAQRRRARRRGDRSARARSAPRRTACAACSTALDAAGLAALGERAAQAGERVARADVRLLAPVPDPEKIICMGLNYRDHAEEAGQEIPEHPRWFAKFANSLIGDGETVVLPAAHPDFVDYEAELAVVIGRRVPRRQRGARRCSTSRARCR